MKTILFLPFSNNETLILHSICGFGKTNSLLKFEVKLLSSSKKERDDQREKKSKEKKEDKEKKRPHYIRDKRELGLEANLI